MIKTPLMLALAATVAFGALPTLAAAQSYSYDQQQSYQQQQDAYQQRLREYNDQKAAYDAQQQRRYGGRYDNRYDNRYDTARNNPSCDERSNGSSAAGGIFGALAGAAIGSSLAGRGSHTEGAVLGAVAGGVIGSSVATSSSRCDTNGRYYSYNQTMRYQEPSDYNGRASGQYDYNHYRSNGCRLVVVPSQWNDGETRYARACPDRNGRYRLTE